MCFGAQQTKQHESDGCEYLLQRAFSQALDDVYHVCDLLKVSVYPIICVAADLFRSLPYRRSPDSVVTHLTLTIDTFQLFAEAAEEILTGVTNDLRILSN